MTTTNYENYLPDSQIYLFGLNLVRATTTTLTVNPGQARDNTNTMDLYLTSAGTINISANGVNALDTGTIAASTVYAVHLIGDITNNNPTAVLLSLSATAPTLPSGYGYFRRIGWWTTTSGSILALMYQSLSRKYFYDAPVAIVTAGVATAQTALSLATCVPAIANMVVDYLAVYTPNTAGNKLTLLPSGSTSTTTVAIVGQVTTIAIEEQVQVPTVLITGVPKVDYKVTSASDAATVYVYAFEDSNSG